AAPVDGGERSNERVGDPHSAEQVAGDALVHRVQVAMSAGRPAVLIVDIHRLDVVNDGLGHRAGDALLDTAMARLMRRVVGRGLTAYGRGARLAVLLPSYRDELELVTLAGHILVDLADPVV